MAKNEIFIHLWTTLVKAFVNRVEDTRSDQSPPEPPQSTTESHVQRPPAAWKQLDKQHDLLWGTNTRSVNADELDHLRSTDSRGLLQHATRINLQGIMREADHLPDLSWNESAEAAPPSADALDHALARLFLRLGPPPEPTQTDHTPSYSGGGGAHE